MALYERDMCMWVQTTERGVYDDHKRDAHMPRWPREVHASTFDRENNIWCRMTGSGVCVSGRPTEVFVALDV